jgi:predicted hotdog family 3-hydroxylacyl-ACP dehydratase
MAVHGALVGAVPTRPNAGYLVSVRKVVCHVDRLDQLAGDLVIDAEQMMADGERVMYAFSLRVGDAQVLSGSATVVLDADKASR